MRKQPQVLFKQMNRLHTWQDTDGKVPHSRFIEKASGDQNIGIYGEF